MEFQKLSQFQSEQLPWCLAFCPHISQLFIGDAAGNLLCHDVMSGARLTALQGHQYPVIAVGCHQNSLYSFDQLQNLVSWNLNTLQINQTYSLEMQGNRPENTTSLQLENFRKGDLVEILSFQREVDGKNIRLTKSVPLWTVATACFTHSGKYLIFGVDAHPHVIYRKGCATLYMIDIETGSLIREFDWEAFFSCQDVGLIDAIAISRDDTQLAASGLDVIYSSEGDWSNSKELIHQWCIGDGAEICSYEYDDYLCRPSDHKRIDLAFSPDLSQILFSRQGWLSLWKMPSPESRRLHIANEECNYHELPLHSPGVFDWSPVSNLVAFGSPDGFLRFIDIATVEIVFEQQVSQTAIQQVLFSQNGEFLAVYSQDSKVEIWSIMYAVRAWNIMIDEHVRIALKQREWTCVTKNVNLVSQATPLVEFWKQYTNGIAVTLSIHYEEEKFVLYQDVGHAASGTKRTHCGTFSTTNAAVDQLIQTCYGWDDTWGME